MTALRTVGVLWFVLAMGAFAPGATAQGLLLEHVSDSPTIDPDPGVPIDAVGASRDGSRVFLTTAEAWVPADTDTTRDVYARDAGGALRLLSDGPTLNDPASDANFAAASADGNRVFFVTAENLDAFADTDTVHDVYARNANGTLDLISDDASNDPDDAKAATFVGAAADGQRAVFFTNETLTGNDTDTTYDIYAREANGALTLISGGPANPDPNIAAEPSGVSRDGTRVFFRTTENLATFADTDTSFDVYARGADGSLSLISDHPTTNPDAEEHAQFGSSSADGARVFFYTPEQFLSSDTDAHFDVYARNSDGTLSHISDHPTTIPDAASDAYPSGASDDGTRVFFLTNQPMLPSDTDTEDDIYARAPGAGLTHVSDHPSTLTDENEQAQFEAVSADGSRLIFTTFESMLASDGDEVRDVYRRDGDGTLTHMSDHIDTTPDLGFSASFRSVSADGTRVLFATGEKMLPSDTDFVSDVYRVGPPPPAPATGGDAGSGGDGGGTGTPGASNPTRDDPPVVGRLTMASRFRAADRGGAIAAASRVGTTVRYALSEPATATFTVERPQAGRRVGRACRKPTKSNRRGRRCTRYVRVGKGFTHRGGAGANAFKFTGRPGRKLAPGKYRLKLVAADAAGNRSQPKLRPFRIVPR